MENIHMFSFHGVDGAMNSLTHTAVTAAFHAACT